MSFRATYRSRTYTKKGRTRRTQRVPGWKYEKELIEAGAGLICGIDEVGMGAWAGPLAVGAVILDPARRLYKIRDSKLLDPPRRRWLAERVRERAVAFGIGFAWPAEIDRLGLSEALTVAARRAVGCMGLEPDAVLIDGARDYLGSGAVRTVVRGDCESVSIAAASLVAKVQRDSMMGEVGRLYPAYDFSSNKGYPSPRHRWALTALGPTPVHRRLFEPVDRAFERAPSRLLGSGSGTL